MPVNQNLNRIFLIELVIISTFSLQAWGQKPFIREISTKGFANHEPFKTIYQSSDGFLWMGSDKGLYRFDGHNVKYITTTDSLEVEVSAIFEDNHKNLWVGTTVGNIYRRSQDARLELWAPEEGLPKAGITGWAQDQDGNLWFSTYGEGVYCYNGQYIYNFDEDDGLFSNDVYSISNLPEKGIVATTDAGINFCSFHHGKKWVSGAAKQDGLPDEIILCSATANKEMWFGTYDKGFFAYNTPSQTVAIPLQNWSLGAITNLCLPAGNQIYIGTEENGLWRYNMATAKLDHLELSNFSLKEKIQCITADKEGNIWVANSKGQLFYIQRQLESFRPAIGTIQALLFCPDHTLWVGSQNGLFKTNTQQDPLHFEKVLPNLGLNVLSLFCDEWNNIWIGDFGKGLFCYQPLTRQIKHFKESEGLNNSSILSLAGTPQRVWAATLGGAFEFNFQNDPLRHPVEVRHFSNETTQLPANYIYAVFYDSKGRLWLGTDGSGIGLWDGKAFLRIDTVEGRPLKSVYSIAEDKAGKIWLSSAKSGLYVWVNGQVQSLSIDNHGHETGFSSLTSDSKGNILALHKAGMDVIFVDSGQMKCLSKETGAPEMEPGLNAFSHDRFGNVWIGWGDQLIVYTSDDPSASNSPKVILDKISVHNQPVSLAGNAAFKYFDNNFIFDFTGIWYPDPAGVAYRYKLEGFDHDWIETIEPKAVYSTLPPGDYTFQVMAKHDRQFEFSPPTLYHFTIKKPFWNKWWFKISFSALIAFLVYAFINARLRNIRREDTLNKEIIESKYELLKSQINPHFLFNSFNTLIGMIEENPTRALIFVEKLSDFYRSILHYKDEQLIPLKEELDLVKNYAYLLHERFGNNVRFEIKVDDPKGLIVPLSLQILVENAVKHNVISKDRPLSINVERRRDYIHIFNTLQRKLNQEESTGFGLKNISDRYALITHKPVSIQDGPDHFSVSLPVMEE